VDNHVAKVHQHPGGASTAFDAVRAYLVFFERLPQVPGQGGEVGLRRAGGNNNNVRVAGLLADVKQHNVGGFLLQQKLGNASRKLQRLQVALRQAGEKRFFRSRLSRAWFFGARLLGARLLGAGLFGSRPGGALLLGALFFGRVLVEAWFFQTLFPRPRRTLCGPRLCAFGSHRFCAFGSHRFCAFGSHRLCAFRSCWPCVFGSCWLCAFGLCKSFGCFGFGGGGGR